MKSIIYNQETKKFSLNKSKSFGEPKRLWFVVWASDMGSSGAEGPFRSEEKAKEEADDLKGGKSIKNTKITFVEVPE